MHSKFWLIALMAVVPFAQTAAAQKTDQNRRFSGTWQAKVKDSVICTINVRVGHEISGSMHDCRIHADADGNISDSEPSDVSSKPLPILNTRIAGDVLSFDCKAEGDTETMNFEMKLVRERRR